MPWWVVVADAFGAGGGRRQKVWVVQKVREKE
jgi:hypothetical protein